MQIIPPAVNGRKHSAPPPAHISCLVATGATEVTIFTIIERQHIRNTSALRLL